MEKDEKIIALSGGFHPPRKNHIAMILDASKIANVVIILNSDEWCKKQLDILKMKSPTSMGVATKQLEFSKKLNLKECLSMEFRICQSMMSKNDFYEGVRANLVDKDRKPNWEPKTVKELDELQIEDYFINLEEKELFIP